MDLIKVGVIGVGSPIADYHIAGINSTKLARVTAVCDIIEEKAKNFAGYWKTEAYTSSVEMLKKCDLDVIMILTPPISHAPLAIEAMEAGKHVFVQKPMATTLEAADEMIAVQKRNGVKMMINAQHAYYPESLLAKRLIDEGKIGDIYQVKQDNLHPSSFVYPVDNFRFDPIRGGGGCMMDIGAHGIYLLRHFIGEIARVSATVRTNIGERDGVPIRVEDTVNALYEFENGVIGVHAISFSSRHPAYSQWETEIYGSKGTILLRSSMGRIAYYSTELEEPGWWTLPTTLDARALEMSRGMGSRESAYRIRLGQPEPQHTHFIRDVILGGKTPVAGSPQDGKRCLEVIMTIYNSGRQKGTMLNVPDPYNPYKDDPPISPWLL